MGRKAKSAARRVISLSAPVGARATLPDSRLDVNKANHEKRAIECVRITEDLRTRPGRRRTMALGPRWRDEQPYHFRQNENPARPGLRYTTPDSVIIVRCLRTHLECSQNANQVHMTGGTMKNAISTAIPASRRHMIAK